MFFDKLFGTDKPAPPVAENAELLCTVYSPEELAVLESILRDAEIPYLVRDRGAGDAVRIITGTGTMFGSDIYVASERLDEASELITPDNNGEETE